MSVELFGFTEALSRLTGIAERSAEATVALAPELTTLEVEERARFEALGGRYVDTGRTMRSLTEPGGPDAIREITPLGLVFGTSVPYARYLTEEEEGGHHTGGSAVLVDMAETRLSGVGQRVLDRIVGE